MILNLRKIHKFPIFDLVNEKFDVGVIAVLKIRLATVLCGAVLQGCKTDCIQNHAAKTGACKGGYCLCSH